MIPATRRNGTAFFLLSLPSPPHHHHHLPNTRASPFPDPSLHARQGATPLHYAAFKGHLGVVKALLGLESIAYSSKEKVKSEAEVRSTLPPPSRPSRSDQAVNAHSRRAGPANLPACLR
jgi:hypothetical protein